MSYPDPPFTQATSIFVTFSVIGFHAYDGAPDEVDYLRSVHRHKFNFRVGISVTELDRELEFHMVKRAIVKDMSTLFPYFNKDAQEFDFRGKSCESIGQHLYYYLRARFGETRRYTITIDEDGEAGMEMTFTPEVA